MNFRSDLADIIREYFSQKCISYKGGDKAEDLAARYCEMRIRHIDPAPRNVHFSNELNDTLGGLANEAEPQERGKALEAWNTVFRLWHLFTRGGDLTPYLSKGVKDTTSRDCFSGTMACTTFTSEPMSRIQDLSCDRTIYYSL